MNAYKAIRQTKVKRVVFTSSTAVHDNNGEGQASTNKHLNA
ncbi:hypothetical protein [Pseudomonas chlororaphis]